MKILKLSSIVVLAGLCQRAGASQVAVVDSGSDFSHQILKGHELINLQEIAGNRVDDDGNKKVDDVVGWNFVESSGRVFYSTHLNRINPIVYKMFEVIGHIQAGTATPEELKYLDVNLRQLPPAQKEKLLAHLNFFGQYAHGTHVSGIVAGQNPKAKIISMRVFPDEAPEPYNESAKLMATPDSRTKYLYRLLAYFQSQIFTQVSDYHNERKVDIANYSLGVPLQAIAKQILAAQGNKNPTPDELSKETKLAYSEFEAKGQAWINSAPETLFVIAAGNDGTDNDALPTFPSNVRADNSISVAAIDAKAQLATFSNFGLTTVDVAAPGVAILSSVPDKTGTMILPLSGTSMAAPYVTGVASKIKDINPKLRAQDIRTVLMSTVDTKEYLKMKVISSGIVNPDRAYRAAELSVSKNLSDAIKESRTQVADKAYSRFSPMKTNAALKDLVREFVY
jgi:cell wall-associated protease